MSYELLLSVALKGTVIAAVAWAIDSFLRWKSAGVRHLVWTAAMAALVALPVLSVAVPAWRLPSPVPVNTGVVFRVFADAALNSQPASVPVGRAARPAGDVHVAPVTPDGRAVAVTIWAAGALIGLLEMLVAYLRMSRVRRSARALDAAVPVPVLEVPSGMPAAFGVVRPVVFLPAEANQWTEERRRLVLLHEIAHVGRWDPATHLLARTALSLYWWNPLVWLAWREFLKQRERAADDLVLNAGVRASDYAGHLLEIARTLRPAPASAGAAVAMARRSQLEGRLIMILDSNVNRKAVAHLLPFAAAALAVILVAPFAAVRAQDPQPVIAPEVEATIRDAWAQKNNEVVEHVAAMYAQQRKYDEAQKLLEAALSIREATSGSQSASYAAGLVKLGDLAVRRHQPKEATAFYTKAVSLGDRPEVVPALMYLGMHESEQAFELFQRALNADYSGPDAGRALMWMAVTRQRQGRVVEAEQFFNESIAKQTPNTEKAGNTLELYARFLDEQGRAAEGAAMHARAQDAWKAYHAAVGPASGPVFRAQSTFTPAPPTVSIQGAVKIRPGMSPPKLLFKEEPAYSEEARASKSQGSSVLSIEVTPDGQATNIQVVKSIGFGLDEKAIEAVKQWKFQPGTKDGQPVTVKANIEVNFRLL